MSMRIRIERAFTLPGSTNLYRLYENGTHAFCTMHRLGELRARFGAEIILDIEKLAPWESLRIEVAPL